MSAKNKILVIDDEEITLLLLSNLLSKADYDVVTTDQPLKGVQLAMQEKPDLIFLDINMPKRNGWSLFSQLRSQQGMEDVPVVILTSDAHDESVELAVELGAASYLKKPVDGDTIKTKISEILGSK